MDVTSYLLGKKSGGGGSTLQNKNVTINENGTTNITADTGYDGLSEVEVTTDVNLDLSEYFEDTITYNKDGAWQDILKKLGPLSVSGSDDRAMNSYFANYIGKQLPMLNNIPNPCSVTNFCNYATNLTDIDLSYMTQKVLNMQNTFRGCSSATIIDVSNWNTSETDRMNEVFSACTSLVEIKCNFDCSSSNRFVEIFYRCNNLTTLGTFSNIGKAYSTSAAANNNNYTFDVSSSTKLTHASLMNIINGLYDIASAGVQTQKLILGSTNLAKLTEEEIAIATNKGWAVS